ncbi:MAG: ATP-grasp domain-containing protein [Chloroflexota bacterium]
MADTVAIIYNAPEESHYAEIGESSAINGVMDEVNAAAKSLAELGYVVKLVPLWPPLESARERLSQMEADFVFNIFEGFDDLPETESVIAGYLEELGIMHTGCPAEALAVALNKANAREMLRAAGILTPDYQVLTLNTIDEFWLAYPVIVKPLAEDASHGIGPESVVNDANALERQVKRISELFRGYALVEQFLDGREFNATVMGNAELVVLPISELTYSLPPELPKVLTFAGKWEPKNIYYKGTKAVCPAHINDELEEEISNTALTAYRRLKCRGYARVDMRLDSDGKPRVLEVNPNPDITHGYGVARQARAAGMTYTQFIKRVVALALETREYVPVR